MFINDSLDEAGSVFYGIVLPPGPCAVISFISVVVICKCMSEICQDSHLTNMRAQMSMVKTVAIGTLRRGKIIFIDGRWVVCDEVDDTPMAELPKAALLLPLMISI